MNDPGEDCWAGTPSMCSEMQTSPSLFLLSGPLPTSEPPFHFRENPTCLLRLQGRSRNTLRRQYVYDVKECLPVEWRVPFNFLPVRSFWVEPQGDVKELQRREGPHSSGPLCSRGPGRGLVSQVAVHSQQWVNTSETLFTSTFTKRPCFPSFVVRNLEMLATSVCGAGAFLQGLSFFLLLLHHPFKT